MPFELTVLIVVIIVIVGGGIKISNINISIGNKSGHDPKNKED